MGRYDKIRVYHNGNWVQPSEIKYYHRNDWETLGTNDDIFLKDTELKIYNNTEFKRVTLRRHTRTVVVDQYIEGPFSLLPASGYCYCPNSSGGTRYDFHFRATIYKSNDTAQRIFYSGTTNEGTYVYITWLADGRIQVANRYESGSVTYTTTSNAVGAGNYVYLSVDATAGSNYLSITFNGVNSGGTVSYKNFNINNAVNYVGDSYTRFKNDFYAAGCSYSGGANSVSFDASTASGTTGQYTGVIHKDVTETEIYWE